MLSPTKLMNTTLLLQDKLYHKIKRKVTRAPMFLYVKNKINITICQLILHVSKQLRDQNIQ